MAVKKHGVHFDITAENATDRAMRAVENNLRGISAAGAAMGKALQGAFVATAAISMGKAFATAAMEAEQASKRLDAVLKATGNSAGLTKRQLDQMADSMAESTQFDDESLRNAQAQMLKFGNIHGETFGAAMKLSADLAAFMGTDLNSAVQMVGKALTSPTEGMTSLERSVGKFNPAAKEMIKNLVEGGNEAKAQAAVLELLTGKVGGASEALYSGLSKAAGAVKKSWNEMLDAFGKTSTFQGVASGGLKLIEQNFKDIKNLVENGTWAEKALALMSFGAAGQMARMGGWSPTLTPGAPGATNNVKGAIIGAPAAMDPSAELTGVPMSPAEVKAWKEMLEGTKRLAEERKRLAAEQMREAEKNAQAQVELEEMAAEDAREAWEHWGRIQMADEKARIEGHKQMWKDVFDAIDREQEEAIEQGRVILEQAEADAKKAAEAAREFGLTMASAFERAALDGEKFGTVLKSLARDLAQMALRKTVTEPLAGAIGSIFGGGGGGDWGGPLLGKIGSFFGGGGANYADFAMGGIMGPGGPVPLRRYAGGGVANSPQLAMFGEGSMNEAYVPLPDGRSIPVSMKGGAGNTYVIDARGADPGVEQRLISALMAVAGPGVVERRALGAVTDANLRGMRR